MSEQIVQGLAELDKALAELPMKMQRNWMRGALRAGAKVQKAEAQKNAPVGPPSSAGASRHGGYRGALRDSIRISTRVRGDTVRSIVTAGGKSKSGVATFYAGWVEEGTEPHEIRPKGGRSLFFAGLLRRIVEHPGARAQPFMTPALHTTVAAAVAAVAAYLRARFAKADIDVPGPENF